MATFNPSDEIGGCDYCGNRIQNRVEFDDGVEVLEFCCNECMENYEERENDRRIERAHERSLQ